MKNFHLWSMRILILMAIMPACLFAQNGNRNNESDEHEHDTHVTVQQAMDVGYVFMHTGTGSRSGGTQNGAVREQSMQLIYIGRATDTLTREVTDCYYVFSLQPVGFVIVAADNRVEPILAYSYDNNFVVEGMPDHVRNWLGNYERQIEAVTNSDLQADSVVQTKWMRLISGQSLRMRNSMNLNPLLQTTWNQYYPYNLLCPNDENGPGGHVYAGCVATAMAQIIRYWQYPSNGIGSHSYNANFSSQGYGNYGTQSANFAATTYNYSLMPLSLNNNSSTNQINEVAKLLYHCGVAVDMMYGSNSSGAYHSNAANALRNYFGYSNATLVNKSSYNISAWIALLKGELDNLRPLYYSGQGTGGHAFVCDGYDDQNNFHFNWGWGGSYDGFYTLSDLTPGSHDYSSDNTAIIGVDASMPMIYVGSSSLTFLAEAGTVSSSKTVPVLTAHLSSNITATVTGNFSISTDNSNFYTSRTLSSSGGTLYVRYQPTGTTGAEEGYIALSSGTVKDTIFLTGVIYDNTPHCLPPTNLSIHSQDLHNISLQWNAPVIDPDPHTLTWASDNVYTNYGYTSENYNKTMLQRFDNADLAPYHNQVLTRIRFYAKSAATTYKAVVYKGGSFNVSYDPGTLVLSQDIDISTLTANTWNTVLLNTPVIVDATQELWFGIYVEAPAGSYCMPVSAQSMPKKGCIIGNHSSGSVTWNEYYEEYSFCIQGIVENVQEVTNYTITRDGTVVGTTTNPSISDYVTDTETYMYTVTANWNNGCGSSTQQSFTNVAQINVNPDALDFFANYGHGTLVKTVTLSGSGLTTDIIATVTENFQISTNGTSFVTSTTLPAVGGILHVKYNPVSNDSEYETGLVTLSSGSLNATVRLSGQCYAACNPPQNLVISQSGDSAVLNWNTPVNQELNEGIMTWYEGDASMNYGSANSATQRYIVHRFDTEDLAPYHGKQLTAISFIPHANATTYRIVVYQGGGVINSTYLTSGTQVVNQTVNISSLNSSVWNTIVLNTPVTIDASQELWYGIYLEAPAGVYPIRMGHPYVAKKGLISKTATASNNNWTEYAAQQQTYCFSLKATIKDVPISLTHYQIDQNEITLGTTNNTTYSNSLLYNGNYDYDVWAVWSNGCKAPVRGSINAIGLCDAIGLSYVQIVCDSCIWNGETYTANGTYYHSHVDSNGCTQVDTLHLTVNHSVYEDEYLTICESELPYIYGDTVFDVGTPEFSTFSFQFSTQAGCDSIVTLHLTVNHSVYEDEYLTICESELPYTYGDTVFDVGTPEFSTFSFQFSTQEGCDSIVTLHLTVNHSVYEDEYLTICESELPYTYGDTVFDVGTPEFSTFSFQFSTQEGCDSIVTLHLTVNQSVSVDEYMVIYDNELPYHYVNGEIDTIFETGSPSLSVFSFQFSTQDGCDSIIILHLTIETGINDRNRNASMKVHPNPTSNIINVQLTTNNEQLDNVKIQVFDIYGKLLDVVETRCTTSLQQTAPTDASNVANAPGSSAQTTQIDLSHYASGVYFIKAVSEDNVLAVRKVVKNQ